MSEILMYTTEDGITKIETTFDGETVWLSLEQMAELFQRNKSTISRHINNIYQEGELIREATVAFFATVQNKMHWATHKHTAAEIIFQRADAESDNMGLTSWEGKIIRKADVEIAKNYLNEKELDALNKIVTAYLDIAEVHALNQEPMYMQDWLETIDDYLKMTRQNILTTKGKITHKQALKKAHAEYEKYRLKQDELVSPVEQHFLESIRLLEGMKK